MLKEEELRLQQEEEERQKQIRLAEVEQRIREQFKRDLLQRQAERECMFGSGTNPYFNQEFVKRSQDRNVCDMTGGTFFDDTKEGEV
jgi:hypothetical protein